MHRRRVLVPLAVLALAALWPVTAHPQDRAPSPASAPASPSSPSGEYEAMQRRFEGEWVLAVPTPEARRTVDAAIDQAVGAMNFFVRGVARPMIRDNTPVNESITLRFGGAEQITIVFDTGVTYTTPLGRTRVVRSHEGDPLRFTQRFRDGALEQVFQADNGTRWNVYTSTGEGRIRVDATTSAEMMPQAMRFSLDYRRR